MMAAAWIGEITMAIIGTETDPNPPATPPWGSDVRAVLRIELQDIDAMAERALGRAGDAMTRIHLRDVRMEIERILSAER